MKSGDILRLYAIFYVNENDSFNFSKKIDMLNTIQHAEDSTIVDLFEQGKIQSPPIKGADSAEVSESVTAALALTVGALAYRHLMNESEGACKDAESKSTCMRKYHARALKVQLEALSMGRAKCSNTNDPEKCMSKVDVKMETVKSKMKG